MLLQDNFFQSAVQLLNVFSQWPSPVGCGKSTLCSAILNEAVLDEKAHITLNGRVAFSNQSAWILNKTLRENILFDKPYDEERYNAVIDSCCLRPDLDLLEDGDMTEIGERGINLSGGKWTSLYFCNS